MGAGTAAAGKARVRSTTPRSNGGRYAAIGAQHRLLFCSDKSSRHRRSRPIRLNRAVLRPVE